MEVCLYDPVAGYYSRSAEQFGQAGDFYTSSDVHAVFGRLLCRRFDAMWRSLGSPASIEVLELGPGRGLFARDLLAWAGRKFPEFFSALRYTLQESSPALRQRLRVNLADFLSGGKAAVPEPQPFPVPPAETARIVFANEFFDALPVEILSPMGKLHLAFENDRLCEAWLPPSQAELDFLERYSVRPEAGERLEVALPAQAWMKAIASSFSAGFLVVIDYGYARSQQIAGHHRGTLMAYRRHSATSDPYQAPGEQDLTAHVNFTALADAAAVLGMEVEKLQTQSQFLLGIGEENQFADAFEECRLPQERAKVALQLKHLISPAGMGETFQVLTARR